MVTAYRPMEQNTEPKNKHLLTWLNDVHRGCQDNSMGKEQPFQYMMSERVEIHMQRNWTLILHHLLKLTKNELKT